MRRPLAFVGVLTVCALAPGLHGGAQQEKQNKAAEPDKLVTSVIARVVRKPVDVAWVTIENKRDVPIVEWGLVLYSDAAARRPTSTLYAFRWHWGMDVNGPIAPGESRRIRMGRDLTVPVAVRLTRVVLADGRYDGTAAETQKLLQNEDHITREVPLKLTELLPSIPLSFELGTASNFVAVIENEKDIPLEAWSVEHRAPGTSGRGGNRTDKGILPLSGPENTRLQPHVKSEELLGEADTVPDEKAPEVRVTMALWQDLSFEGSVAERDALFRQREREAEQYSYWIDALLEAARRPLDAGKLLEAKRVERRKTNPGEGDLLTGDLQQWSAGPRTTPAQAAAKIEVYADRLDQQRQRLMRHLAR